MGLPCRNIPVYKKTKGYFAIALYMLKGELHPPWIYGVAKFSNQITRFCKRSV